MSVLVHDVEITLFQGRVRRRSRRAEVVTHDEYRNHAVKERRRGAHRDERIHIGRAFYEVPIAVDKIFPVNDHDGQREQELHERKTDGVFRARKKGRQRQADHMSHADIHQ